MAASIGHSGAGSDSTDMGYRPVRVPMDAPSGRDPGQRGTRRNGRTRRIVGISALPVALGTMAISGRPYYASGYPAVAATPNVCTGVTAEGCELRLQGVPMEDGGTASVCIQYCPWQDGEQPADGAPTDGAPADGAPAQQ